MKDCCKSCTVGKGCDSHKDQLPGGLADNKSPGDFDQGALATGVSVELEHVDNKQLAREIAMDHLTEDPKYYEKLKEVEKNFRPVRKIKFQGLDISIEHDVGMTRYWTDHAGRKGETKMTFPYGYIRRTMSNDGEQVDVFVGPEKDSEKVYIVHIMKAPGYKRYDEDKVFLGFKSRREAKNAFNLHYDEPRIFGTMTETTIDAFKRMYVKKSFGGEFAELQRLASSEDEISKGLKDFFSKWWNKLKNKFALEQAKPTKTWVRNSGEDCRTNVCDRLDGTTVDIDETFEAMNGMLVQGPPAHKSCKCTLEFATAKSINMEGMNPMGQGPMMPPILEDPHDCETYEGCDKLLTNLWSVKDDELMQIAEKIWGAGYTYQGQDPIKARMEIRGWLLDQQDLLQYAPPQPTMSDLMPVSENSDQPQDTEPMNSSDGSTTTESRSPTGSLLEPASRDEDSQPSFPQDSSDEKKDQLENTQ